MPVYTPPDDIPAKIGELPDNRQNAAKLLSKSLVHSLEVIEKKGEFVPSDGVPNATRAERLALQIERAVHDSHPNHTAYNLQARTLIFNLKTNAELISRLLKGTLTPSMLAAMKSEELASEEAQKEAAILKARAEKQAIRITEDGPRMRRTHKGEELVGYDNAMLIDEMPMAPVPRPQKKLSQPASEPAHTDSSARDLSVNTQHSPSLANFDINKVFSSVKSPTLPQQQQFQHHRLSVASAVSTGPGVDPEVDRLLDDDTQSPPYSPSAETDPDVVWRGALVMNTIATVPVTAKHIGGGKLDEGIGLPYSKLIPPSLSVCGRIDEQQAVVYLCGLRYNKATDVVVVNLEPASASAQAREDFKKIFDYFVSKKRYGVIQDKGVANVRDTYLVPVLPGTGTGGHPEFMLNLVDNYIPETRTEPMLLAVFVYRNDLETVKRVQGVAEPAVAGKSQASNLMSQHGPGQSPSTPTPPQGGFQHGHGRSLTSGPAFSPTSPQGAFPQAGLPQQLPASHHMSHQPAAKHRPAPDPDQVAAENLAREILGPLMVSPTVGFLLPQARGMTRKEWEVIKSIYERDPLTRDNLPYLSQVLEKKGSGGSSDGSPTTSPPAADPRRRSVQPQPEPRMQPQQAMPPVPTPAPVPTLASVPGPAPPLPTAFAPVSAPAAALAPAPAPVAAPALAPEAPAPPPLQHAPAIRNTPIPPPPIPHAATVVSPRQTPPRQTPIPPPPIPPQAAATAGGPPA